MRKTFWFSLPQTPSRIAASEHLDIHWSDPVSVWIALLAAHSCRLYVVPFLTHSKVRGVPWLDPPVNGETHRLGLSTSPSLSASL